MFIFQSPPQTQFDLRFSVFGFPVRVHPLFWLIALLLGSASNDILQIVLWIAVVFFSILVHELGHAFAFRRFGVRSHIVLHAGGGLAIPESVSWGGGYASVAPSPGQQIFISLAGPFAGFLLAALVLAGVVLTGGSVFTTWLFGVLPLPLTAALAFDNAMVREVVSLLLWVNIFWGLINLLPVFPLDGGHVLRNILIQTDPRGGVRLSLWVSVVTGALIALAGFLLLRSVYMALMFGLLAFQSYQALNARY